MRARIANPLRVTMSKNEDTTSLMNMDRGNKHEKNVTQFDTEHRIRPCINSTSNKRLLDSKGGRRTNLSSASTSANDAVRATLKLEEECNHGIEKQRSFFINSDCTNGMESDSESFGSPSSTHTDEGDE